MDHAGADNAPSSGRTPSDTQPGRTSAPAAAPRGRASPSSPLADQQQQQPTSLERLSLRRLLSSPLKRLLARVSGGRRQKAAAGSAGGVAGVRPPAASPLLPELSGSGEAGCSSRDREGGQGAGAASIHKSMSDSALAAAAVAGSSAEQLCTCGGVIDAKACAGLLRMSLSSCLVADGHLARGSEPQSAVAGAGGRDSSDNSSGSPASQLQHQTAMPPGGEPTSHATPPVEASLEEVLAEAAAAAANIAASLAAGGSSGHMLALRRSNTSVGVAHHGHGKTAARWLPPSTHLVEGPPKVGALTLSDLSGHRRPESGSSLGGDKGAANTPAAAHHRCGLYSALAARRQQLSAPPPARLPSAGASVAAGSAPPLPAAALSSAPLRTSSGASSVAITAPTAAQCAGPHSASTPPQTPVRAPPPQRHTSGSDSGGGGQAFTAVGGKGTSPSTPLGCGVPVACVPAHAHAPLPSSDGALGIDRTDGVYRAESLHTAPPSLYSHHAGKTGSCSSSFAASVDPYDEAEEEASARRAMLAYLHQLSSMSSMSGSRRGHRSSSAGMHPPAVVSQHPPATFPPLPEYGAPGASATHDSYYFANGGSAHAHLRPHHPPGVGTLASTSSSTASRSILAGLDTDAPLHPPLSSATPALHHSNSSHLLRPGSCEAVPPAPLPRVATVGEALDVQRPAPGARP